jgi:hypothetical protein
MDDVARMWLNEKFIPFETWWDEKRNEWNDNIKMDLKDK